MATCCIIVFIYHILVITGLVVTYIFVPFVKKHVLIICAIAVGLSIIGILTYSIHLCSEMRKIVNNSQNALIELKKKEMDRDIEMCAYYPVYKQLGNGLNEPFLRPEPLKAVTPIASSEARKQITVVCGEAKTPEL